MTCITGVKCSIKLVFYFYVGMNLKIIFEIMHLVRQDFITKLFNETEAMLSRMFRKTSTYFQFNMILVKYLDYVCSVCNRVYGGRGHHRV